MISTTGMGHLPDYRWSAVIDTVSLLEDPGVEQGKYHTSLARAKGNKMLPSQTYSCPVLLREIINTAPGQVLANQHLPLEYWLLQITIISFILLLIIPNAKCYFLCKSLFLMQVLFHSSIPFD